MADGECDIMKIAIIEDEQVHKKLLSEYLKKWSKDTGRSIDIADFDSAESFLFNWEENNDYDILFVDIQMKEINGIEMARQIRQKDKDIVIVFTTGLSDYMEEGYEVEALQYLIKPVNEDKLRKCLNRVLEKKSTEEFIVVNTQEGVRRINADNIVYIEARGHNTIMELWSKADGIYRGSVEGNTGTYKQDSEKNGQVGAVTGKEIISLTDSLSQLEQQLDGEKFIKCHRSYICNIARIHRIEKADIYFDNGSIIPVSRRMYGAVNQAFIKHFRRM